MSPLINIYCDESCHLERDHQPVMVLGAVTCPAERARDLAVALRALKEEHGLSRRMELKWVSASAARLSYYRAAVDFFFDREELGYRALVADKSQLRHEDFDQDHDTWYYKMYYELLKPLLTRENSYRIFLDIKDTRGAAKARKLHEFLAKRLRDTEGTIVQLLQNARSHELEEMQVADLLSGAVAYKNRGLAGSRAKLELVRQIEGRAGLRLDRTTALAAQKFNLFQWSGRGAWS